MYWSGSGLIRGMFGKASVEGAGMPAAYPRLEVGRCGDGRSVAWFALRDFRTWVGWGQLERAGDFWTGIPRMGGYPRSVASDFRPFYPPPLCPFFAASLKIYLAMLQRVMPPGEKYFARPLGSEGILSLSLHHSAREGRPQGH